MRWVPARRSASVRWLGVIGAVLFLGGCAGSSPIPPDFELVPGQPEPASQEYLIDVGDALDIDFFYQPELSRRVVVRRDGRITVPGLGELMAAGRTPQSLADAITRGFEDLLRDPLVTVNVSQTAGSRIFVVGEVIRPGGYPLQGRMNLATAISEAGGFTRHANLSDVIVVRRSGREKPVGFKVNAQGIRNEGALNPEIILAPNDIVFVPRNEWGVARDVISFVLQPGLYYLLLLLLRD